MNQNILVSVIIPAYNSEKCLGACLDSVLTQDFENFEVVVVDNNSTDRTKEIILEFAEKHKNLKYVFEKNQGRGSARNAGIRNSVGKIIAMIDSDCIAPPHWLEEITKPIREDGESIVMGQDENVSSTYWSKNILRAQEDFFKSHTNENYIGFLDTKNFAIDANLMKEYLFDEHLKSLEDFDFAFRVKQHHKIRLLPNVRVKHNHKNSFASWAQLQIERGFWAFVIYAKYKNKSIHIKNEKTLESINLINTFIFPLWLSKQFFVQPIKKFPFILTSEISWRIGLLAGLVKEWFNRRKI